MNDLRVRDVPSIGNKDSVNWHKLALQKTDLLQQLLASSNATPVKFNGQFYRCAYCLERFMSPKKLKFHTEEDHANDVITHKQREKVVKLDVTNLTCKLCKNIINSVQDLISHLKGEHDKKFQTEDISTFIIPFIYEDSLKCTVCNVNLSNSRSLVVHMNTHFGNFICDICSASYMTKDGLEAHLKCIHNKEQRATKTKKSGYNRDCKCSHCGFVFTRLPALRLHLKEQHGDAKPFACQTCDRTYTKSSHLWSHIKRDHLKERKHKCNFCEKTFFSKDKLTKHLPVHTGEAKYLCDVCPKAFKMQYSLSVHKKTHVNKRFK